MNLIIAPGTEHVPRGHVMPQLRWNNQAIIAMKPFRVKIAGVVFEWSQSLPSWCKHWYNFLISIPSWLTLILHLGKNSYPDWLNLSHWSLCFSVDLSCIFTDDGWENKGGKEELPGTAGRATRQDPVMCILGRDVPDSSPSWLSMQKHYHTPRMNHSFACAALSATPGHACLHPSEPCESIAYILTLFNETLNSI